MGRWARLRPPRTGEGTGTPRMLGASSPEPCWVAKTMSVRTGTAVEMLFYKRFIETPRALQRGDSGVCSPPHRPKPKAPPPSHGRSLPSVSSTGSWLSRFVCVSITTVDVFLYSISLYEHATITHFFVIDAYVSSSFWLFLIILLGKFLGILLCIPKYEFVFFNF